MRWCPQRMLSCWRRIAGRCTLCLGAADVARTVPVSFGTASCCQVYRLVMADSGVLLLCCLDVSSQVSSCRHLLVYLCRSVSTERPWKAVGRMLRPQDQLHSYHSVSACFGGRCQPRHAAVLLTAGTQLHHPFRREAHSAGPYPCHHLQQASSALQAVSGKYAGCGPPFRKYAGVAAVLCLRVFDALYVRLAAPGQPQPCCRNMRCV